MVHQEQITRPKITCLTTLSRNFQIDNTHTRHAHTRTHTMIFFCQSENVVVVTLEGFSLPCARLEKREPVGSNKTQPGCGSNKAHAMKPFVCGRAYRQVQHLETSLLSRRKESCFSTRGMLDIFCFLLFAFFLLSHSLFLVFLSVAASCGLFAALSVYRCTIEYIQWVVGLCVKHQLSEFRAPYFQ